jgi:hypothetical protein
MLNKMSKGEHYLWKKKLYLKFRFAVIIISIVTTVESLEQNNYMKRFTASVTKQSDPRMQTSVWPYNLNIAGLFGLEIYIYLYDLYFPTIAKLYFCMTVRFVIRYDYLYFHVATAPVGHGPLIIKASRSYSDTPHLIGLLRSSDQPLAENSTWQHTTLIKDRNPCLGGIQTLNPSKRAAAYPRLSATGIGSIWLYG